MTVEPTSNQAFNALVEYNKRQNVKNKIPLVPRNMRTGWPLLQVHLLTIIAREPQVIYENHLAGGKCHQFYMSGLSFAQILAQLHGNLKVTVAHGGADKASLNADNLAMLLWGYRAEHERTGIVVGHIPGGYGAELEVKVPGDESGSVEEALRNAFEFAFKPGPHMQPMDGWYGGKTYTEAEIKNELKDDVAIFLNGQIHVDLGALLNHYVKNKEVIDYVEQILKVKEFKEFVSKVDSAKEPEESKKSAIMPENRVHPPKKLPPTSNRSLLRSIEKMNQYGIALAKEDAKKSAQVIRLSALLKAKVDEFYSKENFSPAAIEQFKSQFKILLHSKDRLMKTHRKIWVSITANILIAFSGIGLLALLIKASINASMFFAKTRSEKNIDKIERCLFKNSSP